ncbi:MAG: hypothetical protein MUO42_12460 [Anaerolineaceae bacterium]|nr:hypothetical protein [Anaerolineaceae bacterium]
MEKRQLKSDETLIKVLFDLEPMDWSRRDNGELVFLTFSGQKFVYSPDELTKLQDKTLAKRDQSQPAKNDRPLGFESPEVFIKSKSHHKIIVEDKPAEN